MFRDVPCSGFYRRPYVMQHARKDESSEQKTPNGSVILSDCKLAQVQSFSKS